MLKFRCQHCGQRIAVPARHLGKLVTCAECGHRTHPLAEQIVKEKQRAAPATDAARPCANCGRAIGKLQSSYPWDGQSVCGPCYSLLAAERSPAGPMSSSRPAVAVVTRAAPMPAPPTPVAPVLNLRERVLRGLTVFVVATVALYGALTLLRDIAALVAVAAVAVLALLALYGIFRARVAARRRDGSPHRLPVAS